MKNTTIFLLAIMSIGIALGIMIIAQSKSYIIKQEAELVEVTRVTYTTTFDKTDPNGFPTLFNRETKEMFDMSHNLLFVADTFYVDSNNKIIKIIEIIPRK